jgi:molybdopterin molybdotransferase
MQEETQRQGNVVTILSAPKPQAFVRHQASFYQAGNPLLPAGTVLQAADIAVLAAAQCPRVRVYRRPRVAILSTGSELVEIDYPLQPGQIVDSNQYALAALVAQAGAEPIRLGIVPDQPEALQPAIASAIAAADVVLSSGGVSVGDYDYVDQILASLGAAIHLRSVAMKPGKPLTFATFRRQEDTATIAADRVPSPPSTLYFGLPGNPVSALVTFWRFVLPAIRKLSGVPQNWMLPVVHARSRQELRSDGKRESYLWGKLSLANGEYEFELAGGSHSSGNLINLAGTNGLAVLAVGQTQIAAGDSVSVMQVDSAVRSV